jgi:hypothetical protein
LAERIRIEGVPRLDPGRPLRCPFCGGELRFETFLTWRLLVPVREQIEADSLPLLYSRVAALVTGSGVG